MGFRYLRRILPLTTTEYSYRFYSRNVSRRKTFRILSSPDDSVTTLQQNNLLKLQLGNQNNVNINSVFYEEESNPILPQYETLEEKNSRLMKTLALIRSRKVRERKEKMVLEGKHLISDAINAGMKLNALYFCKEKILEEFNYESMKKVEFFKITSRTMQLLSASSPEVLGVFQRPSLDDIKLSEYVLPVTILCDNIRDPGNLGSIIRHAASAGCQNILLIKGCADPWETKALKVGCGGHFRIPIVNNIQWENLPNYFSKQSKIFIADNSSDIEQWEESPELINYDASPNECEANGMAKQYLGMNDYRELIHKNQSNELETLEEMNLPCYLYSSVMFPRENIVLYVGGETHGVDSRIVKLASDYGGKKVKIPLENSMDSLNSSFAMAIILYEIKRQLSEKLQ